MAEHDLTDSGEFFNLHPPRKKPVRLLLRDRKTTQKTMQRILQKISNKEMDIQTGRTLIYGLSVFLGYLKLENEEVINERLTELERLVKEFMYGQSETT